MSESADNRDIVASNLTIAYCAAHPEETNKENIIKVYREFLELLTPEKKDRYSENEGQSFGQRSL